MCSVSSISGVFTRAVHVARMWRVVLAKKNVKLRDEPKHIDRLTSPDPCAKDTSKEGRRVPILRAVI